MILILFSLTLFGAEPTGPVRRIPGETSTSTIHLSVSYGGKTADDAWSEFLDRWSDRFDINRDGKLSRSEAEAVPALSNSTGSIIRVDFSGADLNVDELVSREELQLFYQARGICSVNAAITAPDRSAIQTGDILWKLLDQDHDGRLSGDELAASSQLLNRWDLNEDECLSVDELKTKTVSNVSQTWPQIEWLLTQKVTAVSETIPIQLDALNRDSSDGRTSEASVIVGLELLGRKRLRVRLPLVNVVVQLAEGSVQKIIAGQQYLIGEINSSQSAGAGIEASQIESGSTTEWLLPLFKVVDSDRNEKLSELEIKSFVALLAEGAAAQLSIVSTIRGRNLFDLLDGNADAQLDSKELNAAKDLINESARNKVLPKHVSGLSQEDIPLSLVIDIRRGPISGRFGRLRIATRQVELRQHSAPMVLPRWFTAMDRNRDETLSRSEFIGPPQRFRELDRNSDGLITSDEGLFVSPESQAR